MKFELIFFLEILAVLTGIVSVWFAKKENILVYPIGIISVLIWVYLCWFGNLFGQAVVNFFLFRHQYLRLVQLVKEKRR